MNLLGNIEEIPEKPLKKIINGQLNVKKEQFTKEELDAVLKKIKSTRATDL